MLHGTGRNTRRYLYAGDAADAFDSILHKGKLGEIYNVDSEDEISNRDLAFKLMDMFDIPKTKQRSQIHFTQDRPFNDKRYAVDGNKLRSLGWQQKTPFEEGLRATVNWYKEFGGSWWGDVESVLTPFPTLSGRDIQPDTESKVVAVDEKQNGLKRKASEEMLQGQKERMMIPSPAMIAT